MGRLEQTLRKIDRKNEYESYENDDYENDDYEGFEESLEEAYNSEVESLVQQGHRMKDAKRLAKTRMATNRGNTKNISLIQGVGLAAQFDILIKRVTNDIVVSGNKQALPIALFGASQIASAYRLQLLPLVPAGVTIQQVAFGNQAGFTNSEKVIFFFTDGVHTDSVQITCQQVEYSNFIQAMQGNDMFKLSKIRMTLNDTSSLGLDQFSNAIQIVRKSLFGKLEQDSINPASYKKPEQFQSGIVDLKATIDVDKETSLLMLIQPILGFQVTLSAFVEKYNKRTSAAL